MDRPQSRRLRLATGLELCILEWHAEPSVDHTIVLVHGFLDLAWSWVPLVRAGLADRFHVVAPDMRGHGDSDRIGAGGYYHFMDYVADLASLVDQIGRRRVSLVGHSMGGSVVSYYTGSHPDRVERLALLEGLGPPEDDTPNPDRVVAWIESWKRALETESRAYPDLESAAARLRANDKLMSEALALELAERGTVRLSDGRYRFKHDPVHLTRGPYPFRVDVGKSFWSRIQCPVLLVEGSESPFRLIPDLAERARTFPNANRVVLDQAGHMMQRHRPDALARLLVQFFSEG